MKLHPGLMSGCALIFAVCSGQAANAAERAEIKECVLKYGKTATAVPMRDFNDCLAAYSERKAEIEHFHLLATTHAVGALKKNLALADSRIANLKKLLTVDFPNARIDALNAGPSAHLGDAVRIRVMAVKIEKTAALEEGMTPVVTEERPLHTTAGAGKESGDVQVEPAPGEGALPRVALTPTVKAEESRENFGRIAARMGQDADRDSDESYPAIGFEAAYVRPNTGAQNVRTELGGTAASMSKGSDLMRRASAHALVGAGYSISGVVIGARLLGGGVWDEAEKWRDDFGGEGRLGFENGNISIFAGIGRTDKTSRFGLDVGLRL
ncbi:MAG: hypothetical protein FJY29_03300 [Betaproteobacteria bacterium]|nr:hypothetical protein [Betaproteobacteria bacterium]